MVGSAGHLPNATATRVRSLFYLGAAHRACNPDELVLAAAQREERGVIAGVDQAAPSRAQLPCPARASPGPPHPTPPPCASNDYSEP